MAVKTIITKTTLSEFFRIAFGAHYIKNKCSKNQINSEILH